MDEIWKWIEENAMNDVHCYHAMKATLCGMPRSEAVFALLKSFKEQRDGLSTMYLDHMNCCTQPILRTKGGSDGR